MSFKSNLDPTLLDEIDAVAKEIFDWASNKSSPEKYLGADPENVRDFVHTLDLLETELTNFRIAMSLAKMALAEMEEAPNRQLRGEAQAGRLGWEFWQIDIENFFAATLLELCYKLSNAWKELDKYAGYDALFRILKQKPPKSMAILYARHMATHFKPKGLNEHLIVLGYTILRRPYSVEAGTLVKQKAGLTGPRLAKLIQDSVSKGRDFLIIFRKATIS